MGVKLVDRRVQIVAALKQRLAEGLNEAAQYMVDEARANANVLTGFMMTHIGQTLTAVANRLEARVQSLAPYSAAQDTGRHGNLFFTRAWLATHAKFPQLWAARFSGKIVDGVAGAHLANIQRAALQDFAHNVTDQGLRVTKSHAYGGGYLMRGSGGRFAGAYGSRHR